MEEIMKLRLLIYWIIVCNINIFADVQSFK